ncbi:uncharacterized protein LOC123374956 isoform X2 [Mauremys mutica]|nr:uncharacterized protein LOC123374956 isoform X2 [Mauremys mutica]
MDKTVPTKQWHPILKTAWQMCCCSMTVTTNKSSLLNEDIRHPPQPVPASGTLLSWGKDSLVTLQLQFGSVPPHLTKLSIETKLSSLLEPVSVKRERERWVRKDNLACFCPSLL